MLIILTSLMAYQLSFCQKLQITEVRIYEAKAVLKMMVFVRGSVLDTLSFSAPTVSCVN